MAKQIIYPDADIRNADWPKKSEKEVYDLMEKYEKKGKKKIEADLDETKEDKE